jgi:hypothetical protein
MVYDTSRDRFVMWGGWGEDTTDTWVFEGRHWSRLATGQSPAYRMQHGMAYDAGRDEVVLFGGQVPIFGTEFGDTWVFSGDTWEEREPSDSPPPRVGVSMVYDPIHDEVVLFGGSHGSETTTNETWVWDGVTWAQRHPATSPAAREDAAMAFDPQLGAVVMFGGDLGYAKPPTDDTWVWDGINWRELTAATGPLPMASSGMAEFDGGAILFGGDGGVDDRQRFNKTWQLRDERWYLLDVNQPRLPWYGMGIATDTTRDRVVAFGGTRMPEFGLRTNGRTLKLRATVSHRVTASDHKRSRL